MNRIILNWVFHLKSTSAPRRKKCYLNVHQIILICSHFKQYFLFHRFSLKKCIWHNIIFHMQKLSCQMQFDESVKYRGYKQSVIDTEVFSHMVLFLSDRRKGQKVSQSRQTAIPYTTEGWWMLTVNKEVYNS